MNQIERERLAVACLNFLEGRGLRIELVSDPETAAKLLDSTARSYSTFPLDWTRVAFTRRSAVWIFAMHGDEVFTGCGVRVDDLDGEDFSDYFQRTSLPTFGRSALPQIASFPSDAIVGRAAYWGDMISPPRRDKGLQSGFVLRVFCYYAQHRIFSDFDAETSYCFMQDKMFMRGAPQAYGFLYNLPFVWDWDEVPYPAGKPDWVSILRKREMDLLALGLRDRLLNHCTVD